MFICCCYVCETVLSTSKFKKEHQLTVMSGYSYFTIITMTHAVLFLLSINLMFSLNQVQTTKIVPCIVKNVMMQPNFGLSAKTKQLVDILQAAPLLEQTIHAGICTNNEDTFSQHRLLPNSPNYICRQRYSLVEVYLKSHQDFHAIKSLQTILKLPTDEISNEFVKDFILVQDGCDILVNFPPSSSFVLKKDDDQIKLAQSHIRGRAVTPQADENESSPLDLNSLDSSNSNDKISNLKPRMVQVNFFRQGLHLQPSETTTETATHHEPQTSSHNVDISFEGNQNHSISHEPTEDENSHEIDIPDNELRLTPEEIGLPVLILDASLDPIMKLINRYREISQSESQSLLGGRK